MATIGQEIQVDDGSPLQVRTYSGGALGTNNRFQFRGLPVANAADSTGSGTGQILDAIGQGLFNEILLSVIASDS